jgi:hypothetical protein
MKLSFGCSSIKGYEDITIDTYATVLSQQKYAQALPPWEGPSPTPE